MSVKQTTFKQRIRKNGMKQRHAVSSQLRKRMGAGRRTSNRYDGVESGSCSMEGIVSAIATGAAIASQELTMDPRHLTDLLLRPAAASARPPARTPNDSGAQAPSASSGVAVDRQVLPAAPLPSDDPCALPDSSAVVEEEQRQQAEREAMARANTSKNNYRHHGQPYVFWERVGLHPLLLQSLRAMHFTHPTPVQEEVLPSVLPTPGTETTAKTAKKGRRRALPAESKDLVVSAETGSGKTLVFALPILNNILQSMDRAAGGQPPKEPASAEHLAPETESRKRKRASSSAAEPTTPTHTPKKKRATGEARVAAVTPKEDFGRRLMHTLIISPTRELALQINEAFRSLIQFAPQVTVGCVVGGMAAEKQQRVLNRHPHVLICTPGRLWELVQKNEGCYLGHSISRRLRYVVLDEADKLLQSGRFEELKNLLERIHCEVLPAGFVQGREEGDETGEMEVEAGRWDEETQSFVPFTKAELQARGTGAEAKSGKRRVEAPGGGEETEEKGEDTAVQGGRRCKDMPRPMPMPPAPTDAHRVVTMVTSATLSLQTNYERRDFRSNKSIIRTSNADVMGQVLQQLEIQPSNAQLFTISDTSTVAAKINECYLRCPEKSKDLYLYYFLKTYSNDRAIVFVNAISMLRRLVKLLEVLGVPVVGLHASMQQRQRLKFIDKFKKGDIRVLVATDVASRGLDIDDLKYVLHYQVPRSTDAYIHRCGRTARCGGTGLSVLMVSAQEHMSLRKLMESLGRTESQLEVFALQPTIVHQLHPHLRIALQIDKLQKEMGKSRAQNHWVQRMSRGADLEVEDMYDADAESENREKTKAIKLLKRELDLLSKKFTGSHGGKGAFRSSAQAIGAQLAEEKLRDRADRQTLRSRKIS